MKRSLGVALLAGGLALAGGRAAAQDGPDVGPIDHGRQVYDTWCAPCHAPGPGHPGTQALQVKYDGELPAVLTEREDLTPEVVTTFVRQGVSVMAHFRKTEITDADLDALSAYLVQAHSEGTPN